MNLASEYHPWVSDGAVDNTLYSYAHAGLWKVEDFLYRAAIAGPRSIEMLCTCYTCNQLILASEYHPWVYAGAVDNTLYLYAQAGLSILFKRRTMESLIVST
jgi:hypothetical protein